MKASAEFQELLERLIETEVDLRAANKQLTASLADHSAVARELYDARELLQSETVKREQAEALAIRRDNDLMAARATLHRTTSQRDDLYHAAKAILPPDGSKARPRPKAAALRTLRDAVEAARIDADIPF